MFLNHKKLSGSQRHSNIFVRLVVYLSIFLFSSTLVAANLFEENVLSNYKLEVVKTSTTCNGIKIISKPILFDKKRMELTRQYRFKHYGINAKSIKIKPRMIVLHWTCTNFQDAYDIFYPAVLRNRIDINKGGDLNVSAHFLVDRDGKVYQLMPTNWMARHTIGLNNIAIGIENVGGVGDIENLTQAQVDTNIYLIRGLKKQYPDIKYLIGHYEYGKLRNTKLWQEKNSDYFTDKKDPGEKFMRLVRNGLKNPPTEYRCNL